MALSSPGIGSGLDVNSIVAGLMNVERQPLNAVATKKTSYQAQVSAYGTLKSALSTFQTAVSALSTPAKFNAQTATSANPAVFTANATGKASIADYAVTVNQLAKQQKIATAGFTNITDTVGTGTLTISFGTLTPEVVAPLTPAPSTFTANTAKTDITIDINASNNTLAGVRDAINAANASVSATIVNDGTTNRLVITSKDTGEINSLKITVAENDMSNTDNVGLSKLAYDPTAAVGSGKNLELLQAAKNALLNIDGIAVVKPSNVVTDAIEGVTLNLLSTSNSLSVNLGVTTNQDKVKESVTAFVDAYNKLDTTLRSLTKYDETGKSSGALLGDSTARSITNQIKAVMTKSIAGAGNLSTLSQVGVSFQRDGKLALDSTKLTAAINTNFTDIAGLFANTGKASDPLITFSGSTSKTLAGTYAVNVSQLGTADTNMMGSINGAEAIGSKTNLTGAKVNASEGLSIKVNGGSLGARGTVTFTVGYAAQLDTVINSLLSTDGLLSARTDGIKSSITRLDKQSERITGRLVSVEARLRAQYTRLDSTLSGMSKTSSFLTQQINALNANRS
jgi:flagellar hook-associated protein 2